MANRPYNQRRRSETSSPEQAVVEGVVKSLGQLLNFIFGRGNKKGGSNFERQQLQKIKEHWSTVESHLNQEATWALAVSEGDKLIDSALQAKGVAGENMGERLKAAQSWFPYNLYQEIWDAHKLRNYLAHEMGAEIGYAQAEAAVRTFRRALEHLNVL